MVGCDMKGKKVNKRRLKTKQPDKFVILLQMTFIHFLLTFSAFNERDAKKIELSESFLVFPLKLSIFFPIRFTK